MFLTENSQVSKSRLEKNSLYQPLQNENNWSDSLTSNTICLMSFLPPASQVKSILLQISWLFYRGKKFPGFVRKVLFANNHSLENVLWKEQGDSSRNLALISITLIASWLYFLQLLNQRNKEIKIIKNLKTIKKKKLQSNNNNKKIRW